MNKIISEIELKQIVQKTIREVLENKQRGLIMEMPFPRSVYKERVDAEFPQVLTNWSLVHYCTITNTESYKKHWKGKFRGHMYAIARLEVKGGDSPQKRQKVLAEIIEENNFLSPKVMTLTICNKFIEEKIDIHSQEFIQVINDCINSLQELCTLILNRDVDAINQYAESI